MFETGNYSSMYFNNLNRFICPVSNYVQVIIFDSSYRIRLETKYGDSCFDNINKFAVFVCL